MGYACSTARQRLGVHIATNYVTSRKVRTTKAPFGMISSHPPILMFLSLLFCLRAVPDRLSRIVSLMHISSFGKLVSQLSKLSLASVSRGDSLSERRCLAIIASTSSRTSCFHSGLFANWHGIHDDTDPLFIRPANKADMMN